MCVCLCVSTGFARLVASVYASSLLASITSVQLSILGGWMLQEAHKVGVCVSVQLHYLWACLQTSDRGSSDSHKQYLSMVEHLLQEGVCVCVCVCVCAYNHCGPCVIGRCGHLVCWCAKGCWGCVDCLLTEAGVDMWGSGATHQRCSGVYTLAWSKVKGHCLTSVCVNACVLCQQVSSVFPGTVLPATGEPPGSGRLCTPLPTAHLKHVQTLLVRVQVRPQCCCQGYHWEVGSLVTLCVL